MLPVTIDSTACYLLDCEEAWLKSPSGEFAVRSAMESGLSQRENRSAFAASTILTLNWRIYVEGAEARRWRAALRGYNNEPVLAPFWPAACLLADLASCKWIGGLRLFFEPGEPGEGITTFQVLAGANAPTSFTPSADCMVVPLAWCRFDSLPNPEAADGDEAMEIDLKTVENGPAEYAIAAAGVDLPAGPSLGALTPRLLDIVADWGSSVSSGGIDLRVDRERIGYGRAEATDYVDQSARRRQKVTLPPIGDEVAKLVALFAQVGNVGSFWVPGAFADARLAADSSASSATITVDDATYLADQHYIALVDDDAIAARRIESRNGTALTLQSSPGAFAVGTAVCPLLLVRFAAAKLKITWTTPTVATASLDVVELPTETAVPTGETVGTTIGDLGTKIWLYHVSDGDLDWYYTSFESEIDAGALGGPEHKPFLPRPIDHGDITSELNLQRHDTDLTVGWFAGSPFERARLDRLAPPLTVQIYEGTLAAPAAAENIFTGKAAGYQFEGGKCTCKIAGPTALFDVRGPVAVTSPRCWTPMYSSLCGLSREALSVAAELVGIDADGTLRFVEAGAEAWGAAPVDHFRYGYAQRLLADGSRRRFAIVGSSGAAGAQTYDETRQWHPQITSRIQLTFAGGMVSWLITVVQSSYGTFVNFSVRIGGILVAEYTDEQYLVGSVKEGSAPIAVGQHLVSLWADVVRVDDSGAEPGPLGVQISRPCPPPASYPEAGWTLVPGCDHSWARCKALGNSANFRGCPHFPKSNPAMVSVKQETSSGSKK